MKIILLIFIILKIKMENFFFKHKNMQAQFHELLKCHQTLHNFWKTLRYTHDTKKVNDGLVVLWK